MRLRKTRCQPECQATEFIQHAQRGEVNDFSKIGNEMHPHYHPGNTRHPLPSSGGPVELLIQPFGSELEK